MSGHRLRQWVIALVVVLPGAAMPAAAADHAVAISNFEFDPPRITVDPGDAITWTNYDSIEHTVTSVDLIFDSPFLGEGDTYTLVLDEPGLYGYLCRPHEWMTGEILVRGVADPPGPPQNLRAVPSIVPGTVGVSWDQPLDDGGSPVLRYRLCSGTSSGASEGCVLVTGTHYADAGRTPLTQYYYTVRAISSFGESPPSAEACGTAGPWLTALDC